MADLIKIIKEEFSNILNEMGTEDIVDPNTINLREEYDKLNKLLFNNSLRDVPLQWDNSRKHLGVVRAVRNRFSTEVSVEYLALSKFYKINYRQFRDVMAHEMIHVWQFLTLRKADHGWTFMREANRINGMGLGFLINVRNSEQIEASDEVKANMSKRMMIAVVFNMDGKEGVNVVSPALYLNESQTLFSFLDKLVKQRMEYRSIEVTAYETNTPELAGVKISKSWQRGFTLSPVSDKLRAELQKSKVVTNLKFTRDSAPVVSEEVETSTNNSSEWEVMEIS